MRKPFLIAGILLFFFNQDLRAAETLKLATTTSTYETGLLDYILPPFEKKHDIKVHIISVGTGKAIKLGENGDVDIILVHDRAAEDKFVQDGYGVKRRDVMYNDFIILGPENDPAKIKSTRGAVSALEKIYLTKSTFVSRGDESGTHKKEKFLWAQTKVKPSGSWYLETGQGMAATLKMADEKNAYILVDRGTYLFFKDSLRLTLLLEGDEDLMNPYGLIAVNPKIHAQVRYELATALIEWLTSEECQKMINNFTVGGQKLFHALPSNR